MDTKRVLGIGLLGVGVLLIMNYSKENGGNGGNGNGGNGGYPPFDWQNMNIVNYPATVNGGPMTVTITVDYVGDVRTVKLGKKIVYAAIGIDGAFGFNERHAGSLYATDYELPPTTIWKTSYMSILITSTANLTPGDTYDLYAKGMDMFGSDELFSPYIWDQVTRV